MPACKPGTDTECPGTAQEDHIGLAVCLLSLGLQENFFVFMSSL